MAIHAAYLGFIALIAGAFLYVVLIGGRSGSLQIIVGDNQVDMNVSGRSLPIEEILQNLLSEENEERTLAILRKSADLYLPSDPAIVAAIAKQGVDSEVANGMRGLLYSLDGPFQRSQHTFYDMEDIGIMKAIEELAFDHVVSQSLRNLVARRRGPFETRATEVLLSVPEGNRIPEGVGATCDSNRFHREDITVFNAQRSKSVDISVTNYFPCPEADDPMAKLIQLSYVDMRKLVGLSPIAHTENGYAALRIAAQ